MKYTWTRSELYNKDGIQIFIVRCNENGRLKTWEIVENGILRKATHEEVQPYLDPDYKKRKAQKAKERETKRINRAKYGALGGWSADELKFTWA